MSSPPPIVVPENYTLHKENSAYLLLPSENGAFLNTIQEFNRDISVACIKTWTERFNRDKLAKLQNRPKHPRKRRRLSELQHPLTSASNPTETFRCYVRAFHRGRGRLVWGCG